MATVLMLTVVAIHSFELIISLSALFGRHNLRKIWWFQEQDVLERSCPILDRTVKPMVYIVRAYVFMARNIKAALAEILTCFCILLPPHPSAALPVSTFSRVMQEEI